MLRSHLFDEVRGREPTFFLRNLNLKIALAHTVATVTSDVASIATVNVTTAVARVATVALMVCPLLLSTQYLKIQSKRKKVIA